MTAQIEWQPPKNMSCHGEDIRTYGKIGDCEVACVKEENYYSKHRKQQIHGWSAFVYIKPEPRNEWTHELHDTKEKAQAHCQRAVDALAKLLTTGTADPDFEWI